MERSVANNVITVGIPDMSKGEDALLEAALYYSDVGWSIIPIRHRGPSGKQPACEAWKEFQQRRPEKDQIMRWFDNARLDGLAVICGLVSGRLTCRDFDSKDEYDIWSAENPKLAVDLPTVETYRGYHVYCRTNVTAIQYCARGELRGAGYCLLPPSTHPSGFLYRWRDEYDLSAIPEIDPVAAGLIRVTESTECTERTECTEFPESTERTEYTDDHISNNSSVHSVLSALSVSSDRDEVVQRAIRTTLPGSVGQRNRAVFNFARHLKAIPALCEADAGQLKPYVRQWHTAALPVIGTKPFDDTWGDFVCAWPKVRVPAGQSPIRTLLLRADRRPLPLIANDYESPDTKRLIALCREMQESTETGSFYLSCRTAGELLGIDHNTAARRFKILVADRILAVAEPGTKSRATRYRYIAREERCS